MTTDEAVRDERRAAPRSRIAFPIELALSTPTGGTAADAAARAAAQVCDLSLSGIRCLTERPIGVMTQVGLLLVLPDADTAIDCRGAVVRSRRLDEAGTGGGEERYETAIFFTSMAEPDRIELQEFLQSMRERTDASEAEPNA